MANFNFDEYINEKLSQRKEVAPVDEYAEFYELCKNVKDAFYKDWESRDNSRATLEIQKRAIIGYQKEKDFFKTRITDLIRQSVHKECKFPEWYSNLADGVYNENWGMAGLAEWFSAEFMQSSSAKIIGDRIYFMENGHMSLRKQTISRERKEQLIKAFLLLTPEERMDKTYYETYLLDGTRVTIFAEPMAKKGQASIIFRRYLIPDLSFEEQAKRGTIPYEAIPLFKSMVGIGFNVVFLGAVRTAKTTFLSTWQRYEDPSLEGVMVETDPEVPMDKVLPGAPIVQLIADGDDLKRISKNLLRSDADYFILAEARDGIALDTAVRIAAKGTKRMKLTFHSRLPKHFPLEAATEIVKQTGGDLKLTMNMVASGFDYLFHFVQLADKSQKRLKGIYQMGLSENGKIDIDCLCEYDFENNSWHFNNILSDEIRSYGIESNAGAFTIMQNELSKLSSQEYVK